MREMSLVTLAEQFRDRWFNELIRNSRAFPNYRDGLKEPTRAILTVVGRLSKFTQNPVSAYNIVAQIPLLKEVGPENATKNLFRFANNNNPLIKIVSESGGDLVGINIINGSNSGARYVKVALSPLGEYVLKYRDYFEEIRSEVDASVNKFKEVLTPLPLSLVIPQVNLSDGLSNDAPNINILQVIDAMCLHLEKDKETTTEELAELITGYEVGKNHLVLTSNQALYDLIERGVMKGAVISPIEFFKNEFLIKGLPYKTFGKTVAKELQLAKILGLENKKGGFRSFNISSILAEDSEESVITVTFDIKRGYRLQDVKEEVYAYTSLNERKVYENICLDLNVEPDSEGKTRPLTIKSVREILNTHYDIAVDLKTREINREINALEEKRIESESMEKFTRPIVRDIISRLVPLSDERRINFARAYLNNLYEVMYKSLTEKSFQFPDSEHIGDLYLKYQKKFLYQLAEEHKQVTEEHVKDLLETEVPTSFSDEELKIIWDSKYNVLYDINKRKRALEFLANFNASMKHLQDLLDFKELKKEVIRELQQLRKHYEKSNNSLTAQMYALKENEREERLRISEKVNQEYERMRKELPVNVLIDKDFNAQISFSKHSQMTDVTKIFECTTADNLVVLVNNGKSYKVPVSSLKTTPVSIAENVDIVDVVIDSSISRREQFYIFATSFGRVSVVDGNASVFNTQTFSVSLAEGERIIYSALLPIEAYSNKFAILVKTKDNLFKQKLISEISVKNRFSNFFALFAGASSTESADSVILQDATKYTVTVWDKGPKEIRIENGFKRNVSKGAFLGEGNYTLLQDNIPVINNYIVPSLNHLTKTSHFTSLSNVLFKEVDDVDKDRIGTFTTEDIRFIPVRKSISRALFNEELSLTDEQLAILLQIYS